MAGHLFGTKPLFKPMITSHWLHPQGMESSETFVETNQFSLTKLHWKVPLQFSHHFVQGEMS